MGCNQKHKRRSSSRSAHTSAFKPKLKMSSVTHKWKHFVSRMDALDEDADLKVIINELRVASHGSLVFYIMSLKTEIEVLTVLLNEFKKITKDQENVENASR